MPSKRSSQQASGKRPKKRPAHRSGPKTASNAESGVASHSGSVEDRPSRPEETGDAAFDPAFRMTLVMEDLDEDTGIYRSVPADGTSREARLVLANQFSRMFNLDALLGDAKTLANKVLGLLEAAKNGPSPLPHNSKYLESEAGQLLLHIKRVQQLIPLGDTANAVLHAIHVGRFQERLIVRLQEHHAFYGKGSHESRQRGHRKAYGTIEERQAEYDKWQADVESYFERNPGASYSAACQSVADGFGRCAKTIERNTKNPKKRK